ncbi:hypothetical protein SG34_019295 [Thalassomonas viridans]|uniref:Uncharacterized protein n=1 Tax=Thalassomonas viridans TaxID=137584 RepID=A0AAF0C7B7_9GAMM|nr:hypothetical protein [Thalassomonas viridans]WDE03523.1 hypothetical protein SG34_019295 [Thalassomonas viridans]
MKLLSYLLVASSLFTGAANAGDTTVVYGDRYTFTEADFTFTPGLPNTFFPSLGQMTSDRYVAEFPVRGDEGQSLLFDLDVDVWGNGDQRDQAFCIYYVNGVRMERALAGVMDICWSGQGYTLPGKNFTYSVDMTVTCSGIAVGNDSDNRNERLEDYVEMSNKFRGVRLRIDKQGIYNGQCKMIKIEIVPGLNTQIQQINADLFFGEPL